MPVGSVVTSPCPVPPMVKDKERLANPNVTAHDLGPSIITVVDGAMALATQSPLHETRRWFTDGLAVSVTTPSRSTSTLAQLTWLQLATMAPRLSAARVPSPTTLSERGTVRCTNLATHEMGPFKVSSMVLEVPAQSPSHPTNEKSALGAAVSVTLVPGSKVAEQAVFPPPQSMPPADDVTTPPMPPWPSLSTTSRDTPSFEKTTVQCRSPELASSRVAAVEMAPSQLHWVSP